MPPLPWSIPNPPDKRDHSVLMLLVHMAVWHCYHSPLGGNELFASLFLPLDPLWGLEVFILEYIYCLDLHRTASVTPCKKEVWREILRRSPWLCPDEFTSALQVQKLDLESVERWVPYLKGRFLLAKFMWLKHEVYLVLQSYRILFSLNLFCFV